MIAKQFDIAVSRRFRRMIAVLIAVGAVTLAVGLGVAPQRIWANVLLISNYLVGIGAGAAFFIALQYLSSAGWAVALRRVPEAMTSGLLVGAVGLAAVFLAGSSIYVWTVPAPARAHVLIGFKGFWLQRPFFLLRALIYLSAWIVLARAIIRNSRRQDIDNDLAHTRRNVTFSAVFMVVFAATWWLASFDWIMSLEPCWYSTIFGVYNFAGSMVSTLAVLIILSVWLQRSGPFRSVLTDDHLHDLGKLLFAFSTFWMYIWFSQYMLIWYTNIPEETSYFTHRLQGGWASLFIVNLFLNWLIPFFALLSRRAKRSPVLLVRVATTVLIGRWLDLYLMIMPPAVGGAAGLGIWEIGLLAGAAGVFMHILVYSLRAASIVPMRDPFILESLYYHQ